MSTLSEREAALRRALQSAAARIEPAPYGLERIQARLQRPRPVAIAWLEAAWTDFFLRAQAALETAGPLLAHGMRHVWQRFGPDSGSDRGRVLRWLRPLAALSLAIFVVAAGTYVGLNGSTLVSAGTSTNSGHFGGGATNPVGSGHLMPNGSGSSGPSSSQPSSSATTPGCKKTPKPTGSYVAPNSSTTSSSPSPTSTGSSSSSAASTPPTSPSPTATSSTPNPADTTAATSGASGGTAGTDAAASTGQPDPAMVSAADNAIGTPTISSPTSTASSRRNGAKSSRSPCANSTTAALTRPSGLTPQESGAITLASAQLTPARLDTTVLGVWLNEHSAG